MTTEKAIEEHYLHGDLLNAIRASITKLGKSIGEVTIEDLAPVDEFHVGGRMATEKFLGQFDFSGNDHILDIGCGLGGASRYVASKYGTRVTGIDLTREYIETGNAICAWVSLDKQIDLRHGSALSMPFGDRAFDGGFMMHVGMNIAGKELLFKEIHRVLRPGSSLGVYDIMRMEEGDLKYPVPWATEPGTSSLGTPEQYTAAMKEAGFEISAVNNRSEFALDFFNDLRAKTAASGGPPPLGLHTLMGENTGVKVQNMIDNIAAGTVAPVEIIARSKGKL